MNSKLDDASCSLFPDEFVSFLERLPARHCCLIGLLSIHVMKLSVITITHYHHQVLHGDSKIVNLSPIEILQSFRCHKVQARHRIEGKALQAWMKTVWKKNNICKVLPWVQGKDNDCERILFVFREMVYCGHSIVVPIHFALFFTSKHLSPQCLPKINFSLYALCLAWYKRCKLLNLKQVGYEFNTRRPLVIKNTLRQSVRSIMMHAVVILWITWRIYLWS